ncbi:MAG: RluA family pseudouridine synthase [Clostridia bacterium]|nr:RluA family pseudouridine synthase [Clostridia bacterium]
MKTLVVTKNDASQRLDKFLKKATVALPDSLLYKYLRKKCVKVNGRHITDGAFVLSEGDVLSLYMNEAFFVSAEESFLTLEPRLCVAYEDEHLLVAQKPAGLSCHPDEVQKDKTLVDHLKAYLYRKGEYDPAREHSFAPALCNRIDRNTAGLVLCAKDAETLRTLSEMIRAHRVKKEYRALVYGTPKTKKGTLTLYLQKDEEARLVHVFDAPRPGAKTAVTDYEVLEERGDVSLLHVRLHTGRTHQIRASFAHVGHPLVGDAKYADLRERDTHGFSHQALCAFSLSFEPNPEDAPLAYLSELRVTAKNPNPVFLTATENQYPPA